MFVFRKIWSALFSWNTRFQIYLTSRPYCGQILEKNIEIVTYNWQVKYLYHCVKSVQIHSFFWSIISCLRTEYEYLLCKSPYSAWIHENKTQKNSAFWHFSRSVVGLLLKSTVTEWNTERRSGIVVFQLCRNNKKRLCRCSF